MKRDTLLPPAECEQPDDFVRDRAHAIITVIGGLTFVVAFAIVSRLAGLW